MGGYGASPASVHILREPAHAATVEAARVDLVQHRHLPQHLCVVKMVHD